jgi:hypothetical protein
LTVSEISSRTEKGRFCVTNPATTISYATHAFTDKVLAHSPVIPKISCGNNS